MTRGFGSTSLVSKSTKVKMLLVNLFNKYTLIMKVMKYYELYIFEAITL